MLILVIPGCVEAKQEKEISSVPVCQILQEKAHTQQDQAGAPSDDGGGEVLKKTWSFFFESFLFIPHSTRFSELRHRGDVGDS